MMGENTRLPSERMSLGFCVSRMAKYLGVDPTAYYEIEQGYRVPSKVTRERISQKLGISEEILFADAVFTRVCVRCGTIFEAEHPRRNICGRCRDMRSQDKPKQENSQEAAARLAREARERGLTYGQYVAEREKGKYE